VCTVAVVPTTVDADEIEFEAPELEAGAVVDVDAAAPLLLVEAGVGEGFGELTLREGGVSGLGSACALCTPSTMAPKAHTTTIAALNIACLALTARVSPLLAVGSMLAQCDDKDNDRDHSRKGHDDAVRDEYRSREPRARVGRGGRRVPRLESSHRCRPGSVPHVLVTVAVRRPPAQRAGKRVGDELVQADALALGGSGELCVERLRHPQKKAPAVRLGRLGLRDLLALPLGSFQRRDNGARHLLYRLVRRGAARVAAWKCVDRRHPRVVLVLDEGHRIGKIACVGRSRLLRRLPGRAISAPVRSLPGSRFHGVQIVRRNGQNASLLVSAARSRRAPPTPGADRFRHAASPARAG